MTDAKRVFERARELATDGPGPHPCLDYEHALITPNGAPNELAIFPVNSAVDEYTSAWVSATGPESFVDLAEWR